MVYLQIEDEGNVSELGIEDRAVIGRMPECTVQLKEPHASRKHAVIYRHGEDWYIRDLDTRNGTFVNGRKIQDQKLNPGDVVAIGRATLKLLDENVSDADKSWEPAETPAPGEAEKIGDYEVVKQIGRSSYARVCEVKKEGANREMVMKILDPDAFAGGVGDLFATVRRLAAVDHPAIASVYEVNPHGDQPYYVSEMVHGESLAELIAVGGRLPYIRAKNIAARVAEGLQAAHVRGIIHGNLKPRNILIGEKGEIKLVDFGGICPADPLEGGPTDRAAFAGIPYYLAPEQILKKRIDERTDIYSLGAIFYLMVGGVPPFTGGTDDEIMEKHVSQKPEDLKLLAPDLPDKLCLTIERALAKDPAARFQSIPELLAALAGDLSQAQARPPEETPAREARARRLPREKEGNPTIAFIAGVLLILMLVAMFLGGRDIGYEARQLKEKIFGTTQEEP